MITLSIDEFILSGYSDLKADNIMMTFEDLSVLHEYVDAQSDHPMPRKISNDRNIYLSHNDFGNLKSSNLFPKISDFGLAHHNDGAEQLRHPIQPPIYHAPEVLLGIPWSYSADIWNLGVLVGTSSSVQFTKQKLTNCRSAF